MSLRRASPVLPAPLFIATASGDAPHLLVARSRWAGVRRVFLCTMLVSGCVALVLTALAMVSAAFLPESDFGGY